MPAGPIGGPAAREAARRELERSEYHRGDASLLHRVLSRVGDAFSWLFGGSTGGSATVVLVLLLGAALVFALTRGGAARTRRSVRRPGEDPLAAQSEVDHRRSAAQAHAEGRYADALREWLRAAVHTIEQRGILEPRPGRTGAEIARDAGALLPSVSADLHRAVGAFDEVWFGERPATAEDSLLAQRVADLIPEARLQVDTDAPAGPFAVPR